MESNTDNRWLFDESTENFKRHWTRVTPVKGAKIIDFQVDVIRPKQVDVIRPTLFGHETPPQTARVVDLFKIQTAKAERYLLVSVSYKSPLSANKEDYLKPLATKPKKRIKNGRKKKLGQTHFEHNGEWLEIQSDEKLKVFQEMLTGMITRLDEAIDKYNRVFVFRFDLHQKDCYLPNSEHLSAFFSRLKKKLKRVYELTDLSYFWAREIETGKGQHYHCVLFLDGGKIQHSSKLWKIVKAQWEGREYNGTMPSFRFPFHYIDGQGDEINRADAFKRISYLAKTRGKGYRDKTSKDYDGSMLKATSKPHRLALGLAPPDGK
jgi:hypothetical protein